MNKPDERLQGLSIIITTIITIYHYLAAHYNTSLHDLILFLFK